MTSTLTPFSLSEVFNDGRKTPKTSTPRKTPPAAPRKPKRAAMKLSNPQVARGLFVASLNEALTPKKVGMKKRRAPAAPKKAPRGKQRYVHLVMKEATNEIVGTYETELDANKAYWLQVAIDGADYKILKLLVQ